jgi:DNA polymerase-3 subunit delta
VQCYPNRFDAELNTDLKNFYLIFGDEPQQKLTAIEALRSKAKSLGFDERQSLVADTQFSWNSLLEATQSLSLFSSKQFIELELPTGKPGAEGGKLLAQLAEQPNSDTLILLHGPKIGKDVQQSKWFKALDKHAVYVPCYPLEGNSLTQWVSQQMRAVGLSADPANCKLLCDFCEGNLLAAKQEIDKLALLHPDGSLTTQDIESSVVDQSKYNVFQLVDVLLSGDAQRTIKLLYRLESEGVEPNIILWALVREWQTLQNLTFSQQQGKSINWNQFRIWKNRQGLYRSAMQRLSIEQLDKIQQKLAFLDKALKQSVVPRPYIEICHICLLFMPYDLDEISLA